MTRTKKIKPSRAALNASGTYRVGMNTGNVPSHRSPDGPVHTENYVHANPDKYAHGHPPVQMVQPRRTQNPAFQPITGRVLRAIIK